MVRLNSPAVFAGLAVDFVTDKERNKAKNQAQNQWRECAGKNEADNKNKNRVSSIHPLPVP